MKKVSQGQVQLSKLIFTLNWEDPLSDEKALQIQNGQTVFAITSGGCNALGFLRFSPAKIYCVDINPAQTFLMELKQAAFRNLNYNEVLGFLGIKTSPYRSAVFHHIKNDLSIDARIFWENKMKLINKGILMNGRYEKFVKLAGLLLRMLQGHKKTKQLFQLNSLEEQKKFYDAKWDNSRWKWVFKMMFNKKRLAKKGLNADYFHFDDGSKSFSESFYRRAAHAFSDIPAQSNYFLALYLLSHYLDEQHLPEYLKEENFSIIKENIDRIYPITGDSKYWLEQQPAETFNAMSLSNICELMNETDTLKLFEEITRTGKKGCRLIFRNLMIPRDVPESLQHQIIKDQSLSNELMIADRSFVYSKVAAYTKSISI